MQNETKEDSQWLALFFTWSIIFGSSLSAYLLPCEQNKTENILPKVYRSRKQTLENKTKENKTKKVFYSTTTSKNNSKTCKIITPDKTSNTAKKKQYIAEVVTCISKQGYYFLKTWLIMDWETITNL